MVSLSRTLLIVCVVGVPGLAMVACGGSDAPTVSVSPIADTSTAVGTWKGSVNGSIYGFSLITAILNADSTMSLVAENPLYCKVNGTWTVSGGQYGSTGRDCDGVIVTSVAPFDKLRLTGTWSASSGKTGTFTMAKQP